MAYSSDELITLAQNAVARGADPEKVSRKLSQMLSEMGEGDKPWALQQESEESKAAKNEANRAYWQPVVNEYRNAVIPSVVQDSKMLQDSPRIKFDTVEGGVAETNYFPNAINAPWYIDPLRVTTPGFLNAQRSAMRTAIGTVEKGLGSAAILAGGILQPPSQVTELFTDKPVVSPAAEAAFSLGKYLRDHGQQLQETADSRGGNIVGGIAGGLLAFPVQHVDEALSDIENGKDLSDAYKHLAQQTILNEAMLGSGYVFGRAPGVIGGLKRAAVQAPAGAATSVINDYLHDRPVDKDEALTQSGIAGLLGSILGRLPDKPVAKKPPPLDDFTAGVKAVDDMLPKEPSGFTDNVRWSDYPEQGDMFTRSGNSVLQGDLFGAEPVEGQTAETRRLLAKEAPQARTEAQQAELERNYIFDRQQRLEAERAAREQAQIDADAQNIKAVPEQSALDFTDVGVPPKAREETPVLHVDAGGNPIGYEEGAPNDAMRQAFEAANTRRTLGLNEGPGTGPAEYYPEIAHNNEPNALNEPNTPKQPELFEPSRNPTIEQTAEQGELPIDVQGDLFTQAPKQEAPQTFYKPRGQEVPPPAEAVPSSVPSAESLLAKRRAMQAEGAETRADLPAYTQPGNLPLLSKNHGIPASLLDLLDKGKLVGGDVYTAIRNGLHDLTNRAPQVKALVDDLYSLAKRFGGENVAIRVFDKNNPEHTRWLQTADGRRAKSFAVSRAIYMPEHHAILLNQDVNLGTIVHEMDHAVKERVLALGGEGKLPAKSQEAYTNLDTTFKMLKPKLLERAQALINDAKAKGATPEQLANLKRNLTYGLKDLHELAAEMSGNGVFRKFLESSNATNLKLEPRTRLSIANFKNTLAALVNKFAKLIGVKPELEDAYSQLFTAHRNVFENVDTRHANAIRDRKVAIEARTTPPNLDFLGEQAPSRFSELPDAAEEARPSVLTRLRNAVSVNRDGAPQAARGKAKVLAKALFSPTGVDKTVHTATEIKRNTENLGNLEAQHESRMLEKATKLSDNTTVDKAVRGDMEAMAKLPEEARTLVSAVRESIGNRALKEFDDIAKDPTFLEDSPAGEKLRARADTILTIGKNYQYRAYDADISKNYMKNKMKLVEAAKAKAPDKRSAKEQDALNQYNNVSNDLQRTYLPSLDQMRKKDMAGLSETYKFWTGANADEKFAGLDKKQKRLRMETELAQLMRDSAGNPAVLEEIIKAVAGLGSPTESRAKYFAGMRRGSYIYSGLENVPESMRAWWGETTNAAARQLHTARAQYQYLSTLAAQNHLREAGLANGVLSADRSGPHQYQLTGESLGPLRGLLTTPDVAKLIEGAFQADTAFGRLLDTALQDNSGMATVVNFGARGLRAIGEGLKINKVMQVMGNAGNILVNGAGSPTMPLMSGNFDPRYWARGMHDTIALLLPESRTKMNAERKELFEYGLTEFSQNHEIQGSKLSARALKLLREAAAQEDPKGWLDSGMAEAKKAMDLGQAGAKALWDGYKEVYGSMDLWGKFANWHYEKDFWTKYFNKHNPEMSDKDIKLWVADRIKNTNYTPSRAPLFSKALERGGITTYGLYYEEVGRNSLYNLAYGLKDAYDGLPQLAKGDPALFLHGIKRLAGLGMGVKWLTAVNTAMIKGVAGLMGLGYAQLSEDDPRKKYMNKDEFWRGLDPALLKNEDGTYGIDLSRPNPVAPLWNILGTASEAINGYAAGDSKTGKDKAEQALGQFVDLQSKNTFWKLLWNAGKAVDITGAAKDVRPVGFSRTAPETYNWMHKSIVDATHMDPRKADALLSVVMLAPKTARDIAASRELKTPSMKALVAAGVGAQRFDPAKDLGTFVGGSSMAAINDAKKSYSNLMMRDYESSPETLEAAFKGAIDKAQEPYKKLQLAVQAARKNGASLPQIAEQLDAAGVSEDMAGMLLMNKPIKAYDLAISLDADFKKDMLASDGDPLKRRQAMQRYIKNTTALSKLLMKYRNESIGE